MRISAPHLLATALLLAVTGGSNPATAWAAPQSASASGAKATSATFSVEQLDQMMAPIALYPDSLLAQVLMASTYPGDVADAVKWSEKNKDAKGEAAVKQVASQPWDPSVQSLVAFPQLLAVLGQDPAWVQKMGDAFLAQPEDVMASVQRLRAKADAAGNLKSNEQQVVSKQPAAPASTTTVVQQPAQQTIVIEPADPEVVYVPSYNPSVVYGGWAYPSYPPYYYPPPPYYYPGGALLSFGIGVAVGGALWGDCNWGGGDIDIDVNRYNEFNSNRQIDRSSNKWNHNASNRDGVPYRDNASRERYGNQRQGASQRDGYRGHDQARNADRQRAAQSLENRGIQAPAKSNAEARQRAGQASRDIAQQPASRNAAGAGGQRASAGNTSRANAGNTQRANTGSTQQRTAASNTRAQQDARQRASNTQAGTRTGNNSAFQGASNPGQSRAASSRGHSSQAASRSSGARSAGRPVQRSAPSRGGGGGGRRR
ncbi:DUF3300 domain-containing protein [Pseudoxanthomonas koreensis]|uniref:DUF3300 domain-containing protein n=1 Tax=Pseudoxanthomonas koreensis TaxID=266061 RepID=UPI0013911C93|nr:DUF3300 domain-containing protein [Pseudoxanthomonas koreensis]KAF1694576.1 hypothetical protein CSC64_03960 [Pseudoxanthomonas koreensis]